MALLNPRSDLYDPIRLKWVENTPEEKIRQKLIQQMVESLGYPKSLLSVEKELSLLPHLSLSPKKGIPKRRADIIAFANGIHPEHKLFPLLMIECKAHVLNIKFAEQVISYNVFVQAPFVAIANGENVLTGCFDCVSGMYRFEPGLFSYEALLSKCEEGCF